MSLIFLVHPINSEVVYYISDSQEILFFLFGMLSLLTFLKINSKRYLFLPAIFLFLSLVSKESGILFFLLIIIYALLFKRKHLLNILIYCCLSVLLFLILRVHAVGLFSTPSNSSIAGFSLLIRMLNIPAMFFYYLKTFLFPLELASNYQWVVTNFNLNNFFIPLIIDLLFISLILAPIFILFKKHSKFLISYIFFTFWFLLGMAIHMQVIPLDATVAEGWFYFPIVGFLGMIGISFAAAKIKFNQNLIIAVVLILILVLSARTIVRSFNWRDAFTLTSHDTKISKDSWALENALSYAYFEKGLYEDAKIQAEKSIKLHPYSTNFLNLGLAEAYLGDYKEAKRAFLNSIKYGDYYQTYDNLSFLGLLYGDPKEDVSFIQDKALKKFPNDPKLWTYLSILEYNFGDKNRAKNDIQNGYILDPEGQTAAVYNAIMNNKPVTVNNKLQ